MHTYSETSFAHLTTVDIRLQRIFAEALGVVDHTIIEGQRGQTRQDELFANGKTRLTYPESKHNLSPSKAVDAIPYPIDWEDLHRMAYFAGVVKGIAHAKGYKIRWGGDWDQDGQTKDSKFNDYVHFELVD